MSYAVSLFGLFVNTYLGRLLPRIEAALLLFYICAFFGVLIPLAYLAPHRSAHDVFTVFQNLGGWSMVGLSFFVGWTTSVSSFLGGDGSDHIAEEIQNAATVIPFSIWVSTLLNGVLGFAMLLTVIFCISDTVEQSSSATGYPFLDIFTAALGSNAKGTGLVCYEFQQIHTLSAILTLSGSSFGYDQLFLHNKYHGHCFSHALGFCSRRRRPIFETPDQGPSNHTPAAQCNLCNIGNQCNYRTC